MRSSVISITIATDSDFDQIGTTDGLSSFFTTITVSIAADLLECFKLNFTGSFVAEHAAKTKITVRSVAVLVSIESTSTNDHFVNLSTIEYCFMLPSTIAGTFTMFVDCYFT